MNEKIKVARLSVISNTFLVIFKLIIGIMMQSVSVISEGIHSGLDLVASLIAYFAVKESSKPADEHHRFGHGKIENVSGTVEAILIFIAAIYIIYEAIQKFTHGVEINYLGYGALIMGISAMVNWYVSRKLMKVAKATDSIALEADAWHLRTDIYTSIGVFLGLIAIKLTGITILDPIIAIAVALMIIKAAFDLTKEAFFNILDVKLPDYEEKLIIDIINQYEKEIVEFHKLRTRKSGAERHIDLHLVMPKIKTIEECHDLAHEIEEKIIRQLPNSHVLIHLEPCNATCSNCDACDE